MSTNAPNSNANSNTNSNANGTHGPLQVLAPFRTDPIKSMQYRHKRIDRLTATRVPEIHYIGQIVHSNNMLDSTSEGVCCRYKVEYGDSMERLSGDVSGQTHVGYPQFHEAESIPLNHPLDLHFASIGLQVCCMLYVLILYHFVTLFLPVTVYCTHRDGVHLIYVCNVSNMTNMAVEY